MDKIQLTVDQKGKLHGGFALQAARPTPDDPNTTNKNCNMTGVDVINTNCICKGCSVISKPNESCVNLCQ